LPRGAPDRFRAATRAVRGDRGEPDVASPDYRARGRPRGRAPPDREAYLAHTRRARDAPRRAAAPPAPDPDRLPVPIPPHAAPGPGMDRRGPDRPRRGRARAWGRVPARPAPVGGLRRELQCTRRPRRRRAAHTLPPLRVPGLAIRPGPTRIGQDPGCAR